MSHTGITSLFLPCTSLLKMWKIRFGRTAAFYLVLTSPNTPKKRSVNLPTESPSKYPKKKRSIVLESYSIVDV